MADPSHSAAPDFTDGYPFDRIPDGGMVAGRIGEDDIVLARQGEALFAVVVTAALPTAQNIFTYAVRYRREVNLARDVIFISTFASVPVILGIAALFHWLAGV